MNINEELILFVWQHRLYDAERLQTTDGQAVEVLAPGFRQHNSGPDISDARLRIGGTVWAGAIEVHVRSSDWLKHGHQTDKAYDNIILHLVFDDDLARPLGQFPTAVFGPLVSDQVLARYERLMAKKTDIPCGASINTVNELTVNKWLDRLVIERLEARALRVEQLLAHCGGDLEQAFQALLFRYLGAKVNDDAFEQLGINLPWKVLAKGRTDLMLTEALLFGQAGLIPEPAPDDHSAGLLREYRYLAHANQLKPMDAHLWKFNRLRPAGFPTVRLSQVAAILSAHGPLLGAVSAAKNPADVHRLFNVDASGYWASRYRFGEVSRTIGVKHLGADTIDRLIINAIVPFMFVRHKLAGRHDLMQQTAELLGAMAPENNRIVRLYTALGVQVKDAAQSQAVLTLKADYCDKRKCLNCAIGTQLLRTNG